jgi:tRNA-splicing ligase RtcB
MKRLTQQQIDRSYKDDDEVYRPNKRKLQPPVQPAVAQQEMETTARLPLIRQDPGSVPVRVWADKLEPAAWRQLANMAALPILHPRGLAIMPDVHVGNGACVGSVLPMRGALVPSAVGLDAGCGMVALKLDAKGNQLPDNLRKLRHALEAVIPMGTGGVNDEITAPEAWASLEPGYQKILARYPRLFKRTAPLQLGTLGAGNHFVEICLDEASNVWVMVHSGSRGIGNMIGQHFINMAFRRVREEGIILPDRGLGWLPEGSEAFDDYVHALLWAQDYARENRKAMMRAALGVINSQFSRKVSIIGEAINCHHNYAARENHFGEDLWITRKGAIRAGAGEWGIIPGSMGAESFIVRGKGAEDSYCSCSHGAGRIMSRSRARETFTTLDLKKQTQGVECRKDRAVVDEIPGAYKNIRVVMAQQSDLVEIVHTLKQVVCLKGA